MDEVFDIDGLVGRDAVHAVGCGDDVTGLAVLKNQFDTVGGIVRIAGDIGCSGLQHAEERENQSAGTRQQQGDTVALHDATLVQPGSDAAGDFVHLFVGELSIAGYQGFVVGLRLCEVADTV